MTVGFVVTVEAIVTVFDVMTVGAIGAVVAVVVIVVVEVVVIVMVVEAVVTITAIEVVALISSQGHCCYRGCRGHRGYCSPHGKIYIGSLEGLHRVACKYATLPV